MFENSRNDQVFLSNIGEIANLLNELVNEMRRIRFQLERITGHKEDEK